VFELGRVIGGPSFGLTCELACGSTALFFKFARLATSDVQLALWVSVANVFLCHAIFHRRRWAGCVGAGIALGLALMSKGPVALVESVLPVLAFLPFRAKDDAKPKSWTLPILVGLGLMLLIELPWYIYILHRLGNLWHAFSNEITGADSPGRASPWYSYFGFVWLFLPWLPMLILGAIVAVREWHAQRGRDAAGSARRLLFALFLFVIPLLVLSFFKDKRDRYVLPMVGPAAILAAAGATHCLREIRRGDKGALIWRAVHYWTLLVLATVLPIGGAIGAFDQVDMSQKPVFGPALALGAIAVCWLLLGIGFLLRNTRRPALAPITAAVMLVLQALFFWGYSKTDDGVSPVGPLAGYLWSAYPDARILNVNGSSALGTTELSIYFDRPFTPIRAEYALKLTPGPQPIVAVIKLPTGDPVAARAQLFGAFAGWRFIDRIIDDTHVWYVFLLPAKSAVAQPTAQR
jgi:4-amino-4-deoxy-L-arabinose transferase-like glycosyltransferase